jgi:cell division protein FtsI (penicillin-binding protein 3)
MADGEGGLKSIRIIVVILGISLWSICILVRLVQLQVLEHDAFTQLALQKQQVTRSILAPRGVIYDSHMDEIATSVFVSTVVAEPRKIRNKPAAAMLLAKTLDLDPLQLEHRMKDPSRQAFMIVKRKIDPATEKRIVALGLDGIYFLEESMRAYPNRELASQTLGFVNMNGDGATGIELQYDRELKGKEGVFSFDVDARRRSFRVQVDKPPVQGHSLVLSIDKSIQYVADRELAAGVEKANARGGIAIIMESETGRILALSNYPSFNCNTYNEYDPNFWRNKAVSDFIEPGSTFKVVVATAALEAGLTRPDEMIDCQMGAITIGGHPFRDHNRYGLLSFSQVLEFSSNVGAIKLGLRLGPQKLYEAIRNFGFGSKTGVDLPGEIIGLVRDWHNWSGLSIGAISFGQEVGVTSLQMLAAINSIANGGYRVRPSIVDRIIDEKGDLVSVRTPERIRIVNPQSASAVSNAFERVVLSGTARRAALEGYRAAGKTGTAQKIVNGRYSPNKYVSSFIGFAPLPLPRITILVQIDEPQGVHYGGEVSAPVFKAIAQESLLQLHVPPDKDLLSPQSSPKLVRSPSKNKQVEEAPIQIFAAPDKKNLLAESPDTITMPVEQELVILPDFQGLSKRTVLNRCLDLGIRLQSSGSGMAVFQSPMPGTKIPIGAATSVTFAKGNVKLNTNAAILNQNNSQPSRP